MARFKVDGTYKILGRNHFGIAGTVSQGRVAAGMFVTIPNNADQNLHIRIDSLEFGSKLVNGQKEKFIGLNLRYKNEDEYLQWKAINIDGQELHITDAQLED